MSAHRFVRVTGFCTNATGPLELSELRLYQDGLLADEDAILTVTLPPTSGMLAALWDDSAAEVVSWAHDVYSQPGFAFEWDFGVDGSIDASHLRLGSGNSSDSYPRDLILQYSADRQAWSTDRSVISAAYPGPLTLTGEPEPGAVGDIYFANTVLHLNASDDLTDRSPRPLAVTVTGNTHLSADADMIGGKALLFDGSGDWVSAGVASDWTFMHIAFAKWTFACSIKVASVGGSRTFISTSNGSTGDSGIWIGMSPSRTVQFQMYRGVASSWVVNGDFSGLVPDDGARHHIEIAYDHSLPSGNAMLFIDGVPSGTLNKTTDAPSAAAATAALKFGGYASQGDFLGLANEIHIAKGVVRHSSAFTPPTEPQVDNGGPGDANFAAVVTLLQLDGPDDSTTITDTGPVPKNYTVVGAKIKAATPLGGSSLYFDGASYAACEHQDFDLQGVDYTVAFYLFRLNSLTHVVAGTGDGSRWSVEVSPTGALSMYAGLVNVASAAGAVPVNTAVHIAIAKQGTVTRLFAAGALVATISTQNPGSGGAFVLGARASDLAYKLTGYIKALRIDRGFARYTSGFVPPTPPLPGPALGFVPVDIPTPRRWRITSAAPYRVAGAPLPSGAARGHLREVPFMDAYHGGLGIVYGTVEEDVNPTDRPLRRKVWLMDERAKLIVRETWSDATTGYFEFRGVRQGIPWLTLTLDHLHNFQALASDNQFAVAMVL